MLLRSCAMLLALATTADAQTALFTVTTQDFLVRRIDPVTGATIASAQIVVPGLSVTQGQALAVDPTTGLLYAVVSSGGAQARRLIRLNPLTGAGVSVGDLLDRFAALAFDSSGQLYGVTGDGANVPEALYRINKASAAKTLVQALGNGINSEAMDFQPYDGLLYHASGNGTLNDPVGGMVFETVDPVTHAVTPVTLSGGPPVGGLQCLTRYDAGSFLTIDQAGTMFTLTTSGAMSAFATVDHLVKGLAFLPGPSYFAAYGAGCVGSGGFTPTLAGSGTPNPGTDVTLQIAGALGGATTVILLGTGNGSAPIKPACSAQIAPLLPVAFAFVIPGAGPGGGALSIPVDVGATTTPTDLFLQVFFADPGAPGGLAATNPLRVHAQ